MKRLLCVLAGLCFLLTGIFAQDEGITILPNGDVGINTATPDAALDVEGDVVVSGSISGFGIVPIGSIIAWHKNLAGVPSLPEGFMECNGDTVNDIESPLNGVELPNLNGENRFLRGNVTSGIMQNATQIPSFKTFDAIDKLYFPNNDTSVKDYDEIDSGTNVANVVSKTAQSGGHQIKNVRVRVKNMSVVWIMRIK